MQSRCKLKTLAIWLNERTFASKIHNKSNPIKNVKLMKKVMLVMAMALMSVMQMNAQTQKVADKEIVGVWLMESMQWDGERKTMCGKETGYTQFKYYGADGEYACAQIVMNKDGQCVVMPHEYGTYTFKDGWYSEMGREAIKDAVILTDKNTYKGRWMNRNDIWKKQANMPEKLVNYILSCCRAKEMPAEINQLIKQAMFK
jgi:hypothetical protein